MIVSVYRTFMTARFFKIHINNMLNSDGIQMIKKIQMFKIQNVQNSNVQKMGLIAYGRLKSPGVFCHQTKDI